MSDTASLKDYATSQAEEYGIPPDLFANMISTESSWNPDAVSPKGARGIVQIMPQYHPGVDPFDPYAAIKYAAQTLSQYFNQFGSWQSAFAAWNAGPTNVSKYSGVPPFAETQNYINKIFGTSPLAKASLGGLNGQVEIFFVYAAAGILLILAGASMKNQRKLVTV